MVESNITRRRVLQGAGAIGVASLGSTVISAQEDGDTPTDQSAAIRVAHASPDAPNVDVRLNSMNGGGAGGGNQANQTNDTGGQDGGGEEDPEIGGVGFRNVSGYNEVAPGSYRMEIVPAEGGLLESIVADLFGGDDEDERTVLFDGEIEVEAETTYTVVAFGEVARGPIPARDAEMDGNETDGDFDTNETDGVGTDGNATDGVGVNETDGVGANETGDGMAGNETDGVDTGGATGAGEQLVQELAFGEHETVDLDAGDYTLAFRRAEAAGMGGDTGDGLGGNETDGIGANETDGVDETDGVGADDTTGQTGDSARGFQVKILEDDISAPGEGAARMRIFHAVPDVDTMSVSQVAEETPGGATPGGATPGGATPSGGGGANDTGIGQNDTGGVGGDGGPQQEEGVRRAQISPAGNTAYSGFGLGYFDPQTAASAGDGGGDGNLTDGGNITGDGNATGDGNVTGNATGDGEEVAEDAEGEEFEFVTVQDAQGGTRSDGGTDGLFDLAPPVDD